MVPLLAEPVKGKLPITTVAPIQPGRSRSAGIPLAGQPHEDPQPRWVRRAPGAKGTRRQKSEKSRPESPETMSYATRGSATAEKPPAREGLRQESDQHFEMYFFLNREEIATRSIRLAAFVGISTATILAAQVAKRPWLLRLAKQVEMWCSAAVGP